jgi:hypothetical protein
VTRSSTGPLCDPRELFEILETCMVPGGAPTFHRSLSALIELDAEETK